MSCVQQVKVVPDFSAVNVYWLSTGSDDNAYVEQLLKKKESTIRWAVVHPLHLLPFCSIYCTLYMCLA